MGGNWGVSSVVIGMFWLKPVEMGEIHSEMGFSSSNVFYVLQDPTERDFGWTQASCYDCPWVGSERPLGW